MTTPPAIIHVSPYPDWPIDPGELLAAIQEHFGDQADAVWDLLAHVKSVPAADSADRLYEAFVTVEAGYTYAHERTTRAYWNKIAAALRDNR